MILRVNFINLNATKISHEHNFKLSKVNKDQRLKYLNDSEHGANVEEAKTVPSSITILTDCDSLYS